MTMDKIVQLSPEKIRFDTVEQAIEDIKAGKFVVIADDEGRENEGDLVCAASLVTPEMVNFMAKEARGLICVSLTANQAENLGLPPMVEENTDPNQTAFTISIDAGPEFGVTTGISASDRATTIQRMTASNATPQDFRRPGHIFPVQAKNGGVLRRVGHSEASADMARLAGLTPMGVMCEILNDDGSMARRDDLAHFAKKHGLCFITVAQIIQYRLQSERDVVRRVTREIDTKFGRFTAIGYRDMNDGAEHLALVKGDLAALGQDAPYVRVQHENIITDVLGRTNEDVPHEIAQALSFIEAQGKGAVIYLRQRDDSAHGLIGSLKAYAAGTPSNAYHAGKADLRDYGVGAQILLDLGIKSFRMLGRSTKKIVALRGYGLEVVDNMPLANSENFDFEVAESDDAVPAFVPAVPQADLSSVIAKHNAVTAVVDAVTASILSGQESAKEAIKEAAPEVVTPEVAASHVNTGNHHAEYRETPVQDDVNVAAFNTATPSVEQQVVTTAELQQDEPVQAAVIAQQPEAQQAVAQTSVDAQSTNGSVVPLAQNENKKMNGNHLPENTFSNQHPVTMKMGGQVISNQALFEG